VEENKSLQQLLLQRISEKFFSSLPQECKKQLFSTLCNIAVASSGLLLKDIKSVMSSLKIHSSLFVQQLAEILKQLEPASTPSTKKRKSQRFGKKKKFKKKKYQN